MGDLTVRPLLKIPTIVQTQAFTLLDRNYIRKVRIPGSREAEHHRISI